MTASATTTVNDLLRRHPGSIAVLNRFGVDTCCGASLPLEAAALNAGVPLEELLAALEALEEPR